ncbi:MAG: class I SAM-dependent methyltransferase [bacterium]|nr:class I SAM-dependent methyltransferase [bacterium]
MSSLALMRWLESSPERYDAGMRFITFGNVTKLHAAVAAVAASKPGDRVLEVGCGTGTVTQLLLGRGADVTAIDQSPEMLEQAKQRLAGDSGASVRFIEQTAAEIDGMADASCDAIVLSLSLSDMSPSERAYVLREAGRLLAPGGRLVAADEVHAPAGGQRWLQRLWRFPQAVLGWLLVGSLSQPIADLSGEIRAAGFEVCSEQRWMMGNLALVVAEVAA